MKLRVFGVITTLLLTANVAFANHEVIVIPETHSGHQTKRQPGHQTGHHDDQHLVRRSRSRLRGHQGESQVQHRRPYLTLYFGGGFGSGGDVLGRFTDNVGDTERVRSGGGFNFEGGLLAALDNSTLLRLTAGFETDRTSRSNGLASFDRTRFDLTLLRNFGAFELGVGLTAHVGVDYDCSINSICADGVEFDNALGYTIEYALTSFNHWNNYSSRRDNRRNPLRTARLGLRFTDIEYTPEFNQFSAVNDDVLDGKSLSLFVGFAL